ncbi:MAG: DUF4124 domain-containing protein [Pontibacterium sp.]
MKFFSISLLLFTLSVNVSADVYRCKVDGRVAYQDRPCIGVPSQKVEIYTTPSAQEKSAAKATAEKLAADRKQKLRLQKLVDERTLAIGMTSDQAQQAWGQPCQKLELPPDNTAKTKRMHWVYCQSTPEHIVVLEEGVIVDVQQKP